MDRLEFAILGAIMEGETTLLILDRLKREVPHVLPEEPLTEDWLLDVLHRLEKRGLVTSWVQHFAASDLLSTGGLPELALGRSDVQWWYLTTEARRIVGLRPPG